ncbi:hypothetical protein D9758_000462 [Tetrapyrgos nigripes]|uniref:GPI inositol-deacylase n=1 Tax=Tetrapyrgos nigripes TaxID=182062 RepID=A0A8H5H119_9AGAR|nr:hypothetical protein D9758_000462 [Tetrapyrgos nigripes]
MPALERGAACDVCYEVYDKAQRVPSMIPCGHMFCSQCLNQISSQARISYQAALKCPMCRAPFRATDIVRLLVDVHAVDEASIVAASSAAHPQTRTSQAQRNAPDAPNNIRRTEAFQAATDTQTQTSQTQRNAPATPTNVQPTAVSQSTNSQTQTSQAQYMITPPPFFPSNMVQQMQKLNYTLGMLGQPSYSASYPRQLQDYISDLSSFLQWNGHGHDISMVLPYRRQLSLLLRLKAAWDAGLVEINHLGSLVRSFAQGDAYYVESFVEQTMRNGPRYKLGGLSYNFRRSGSHSPTSLEAASAHSLQEALRENLPQHPSPVRLRQPPLLNSLTRSTLPTATLSQSSSSSPTSISHRISPSKTSLDSLRSVSRRDSTIRSTHTKAAAPEAESSSGLNLGWWFQYGNKDNVDSLLEKEDRADTVLEEQERIRRKYRSPKNPVVFCHGLLGFDSVTIGPAIAPMQVTHWRGIKEVLEANGTEVLITRVPATSSPYDRARVLEEKISETYPGRSVHLIGHSMGGIDCRYLTTHLTYRKFSVLSVTTIASPHRGSSFADHFLETLGRERMPSFLQFLDLLPNGGGDGKAFECLTIESMRKFNETVPDIPGVKYFSWGAVYDPGFVDTWKWPHSVVLEKEGPNDGLVSVHSAKWGKYLGTLQNVSHLDLVGWTNTARYKWAEMTGREIKFRPATFYLGIADMLAKEVEGQTEGEGEGEGDEAGRGADVVPPDSPAQSSSSHSNFASGESRQGEASNPGETIMTFASREGNDINEDDTVVVRGPQQGR